MSQNNLELLFKLTQQAAQKLKQQDPDADGKAFWQPLKKLFETYALSASQWQQLDPELVKKLSLLPETDSLGRTIEINHFLRQQVRIPLEEPPSLRRIMQLALNSGQFMGINPGHAELDPSLIGFDYKRSRLNCLSTYLAPPEIIALGSQITVTQVAEVSDLLSRKI